MVILKPKFVPKNGLICEMCDNQVCGNKVKKLYTAWSFDNMQVCSSCWIDLETK